MDNSQKKYGIIELTYNSTVFLPNIGSIDFNQVKLTFCEKRLTRITLNANDIYGDPTDVKNALISTFGEPMSEYDNFSGGQGLTSVTYFEGRRIEFGKKLYESWGWSHDEIDLNYDYEYYNRGPSDDIQLSYNYDISLSFTSKSLYKVVREAAISEELEKKNLF